jgi:hypothetical protein
MPGAEELALQVRHPSSPRAAQHPYNTSSDSQKEGAAFYRSNFFEDRDLPDLAHSLEYLAATPDDPGINPDLKRVRDDLREEHRQITADLARYDRMRRFENRFELGAAALGQLGGGLLWSRPRQGGSLAEGGSSLSRSMAA